MLNFTTVPEQSCGGVHASGAEDVAYFMMVAFYDIILENEQLVK